MAISPIRKRRWSRLALFPLIGVIVLGSYVSWHRHAGLAKLTEVQAAQAAAGLGGSLKDLLAELPLTDAPSQQRWWVWQTKASARAEQGYRLELAWSDPDVRKWRLGLSPLPPANLVEAQNAVDDLLDEVSEILDGAPLIAGAAGFLRATARPDDDEWLMTLAQDASDNSSQANPDPALRSIDIHALRLAAQGLACRGLMAGAPGAVPTRLDKLVANCRPAACLIDAFGCATAIRMRDEALFGLAVRGSLSAEQLSRWMAGSDQDALASLIADGFRGERLLRLGSLAELAKRGILPRFTERHRERSVWEARLESALLWWDGSEELALDLEALADAEQRIRRGPAHPFSSATWNERTRHFPLRGRFAMNLVESVISAQQIGFQSRCWRVAALLVLARRAGHPLPEGREDLGVALGTQAGLLAGGPDRLAIGYERLSPGRFRLGVDLARSVDGEFTPFDRYRRGSPMLSPPRPLRRPEAQPAIGTRPPPTPPQATVARDDVPPAMSWRGESEFWVPDGAPAP